MIILYCSLSDAFLVIKYNTTSVSNINSLSLIIECKTGEGYIILDSLGLALIFILSLLYFSDRNLNWHIWKSNIGPLNKLKGFIKLDVD